MTKANEKRPVVVVVEDDANVAALIEQRLTRSGFSVSLAPTLAAARVRLTSELDWDVAVLDRQLPDGDGIAFCGELRRFAPHAYIVMLTGDDRDAAKLEGFERGADDYVTKPFQFDEFVARIRAGARIVQLQKALLESNRRLEELSLTDSLTGLRNRRSFQQSLAAAYEHARRYDRPLSLIMVDVDHFKSINDTHGHDAGDAVLRKVAEMLDANTRNSDITARVGGEEFAILLPETPLFEAIQVAEKIRATIASEPVVVDDVVQPVTISAGLVSMPHSAVSDRAELFHAADQALYRAKNSGRNRIEIERRRTHVTRSGDAPQYRERLAAS